LDNKGLYKATRADISMKPNKEFQRKILKTIAWSIGLGTIGFIVVINFLFYFAGAIAEKMSQLFWGIIYLLA